MLAVCKTHTVSGSSPEAPGRSFECKNCSGGHPERIFVFPRSELNLLTGGQYNLVNEINVYPDRIEVRARQQGWYGPAAIYDFTHELELRSASFEDVYWDWHRRLEIEGKIKHSREECPERYGPQLVRAWSPEIG